MLKRQRSILTVAFIAPALLLYLVFIIYPAIQGLWVSAFDWSGLSPERTFVGLDNYARLWREFTDPDDYYNLRLYVGHNIVILGWGFLSVLVGLAVAFIISQKPIGHRLYRITFFFPNVIALPVVALLWAMTLNPAFGLVNSALASVGLEQLALPWLSLQYEAPFARLGLHVVGFIGLWGGVGWFMLIFLAAMQNIPKDYYEAAYVDGANRLHVFRHVTIPMIWETVRTVLIYTLIGALGGFALNQILFGSVGSKNGDLILNYYYYQAFQANQWGYAAAVAGVVFLVTFALTAGLYFVTRRDSVQY
jgi:N-acetylglucosamine transport system permease protein